MSIVFQERLSDLPLIASVTRGETVRDGSSLRPAVNDWHMVFVRHRGNLHPLIVGPKTTASIATWEEGPKFFGSGSNLEPSCRVRLSKPC